MERVPFQATQGAALYDAIGRLPVDIVLENIRSLHNVGSLFRTADGTAVQKLWLCGITGCPPARGILKTALGAERTVAWEYRPDALPALDVLRHRGYELVAIETGSRALDIFDWQARFPVCVVLGNEVDGVSQGVAAQCDTYVRIPMLGLKHSLNVATAGGIVMYELLRKYRVLFQSRLGSDRTRERPTMTDDIVEASD